MSPVPFGGAVSDDALSALFTFPPPFEVTSAFRRSGQRRHYLGDARSSPAPQRHQCLSAERSATTIRLSQGIDWTARHQCLSAERSATTAGIVHQVIAGKSPVPFGGAVSDDCATSPTNWRANNERHQCLSAERSATTRKIDGKYVLVHVTSAFRRSGQRRPAGDGKRPLFKRGHQCLSAERSATTSLLPRKRP